jgi:hypothetical protein
MSSVIDAGDDALLGFAWLVVTNVLRRGVLIAWRGAVTGDDRR